mgnify:FL=1
MKIGNQRGLTLLELLLSIVILGIISTCVISVALTSTRVSSRTNESLFSANITYNIHELWLDHTFNDTDPSYESFFNTLAMFYDAENLASDDALSGLDSPLSVDSGSFSLKPFGPDLGLARAVYKTSSADPLVGKHVYYIFFSAAWSQCSYGDSIAFYAAVTPFYYETSVTDISVRIFSCTTQGSISGNDLLLYNFTES